MSNTYIIALGSNMRVPGIGGPRQVVLAAGDALQGAGIKIVALSRIIDSDPLGPSLRRYANAAALIESALDPPGLLDQAQRIERIFGRSRTQRMGQRWRARALDIDIILWSGGIWADRALTVPHCEMRLREFVLGPSSQIAGRWRDPVTRLTLAQLCARLNKRV